MRRKAAEKKVTFKTPVKSHSNARKNNSVAPKCRRTYNGPAGKGLGKAGAKRLGRLLKRAVQSQEESARPELSLPKTPIRLFKHRIQSTDVNGPQARAPKRASPQISQLILSLVSQCRRRGGMTMDELKQTLTTEGYNVAKNNKHVTMAAKRLLNNDKLVQTRAKRIRLNKPSVKTLPKKTPIKKDTQKLSSTKAATHPKSTTVRGKSSKTQTQARRALKRAKPESERSKSVIKQKGKTQTRTQKRRARTAKGRPKLKAIKKRGAMSTKRKNRTVKTTVKTHARTRGIKRPSENMSPRINHQKNRFTQDNVKLQEMGGIIRSSDK